MVTDSGTIAENSVQSYSRFCVFQLFHRTFSFVPPPGRVLLDSTKPLKFSGTGKNPRNNWNTLLECSSCSPELHQISLKFRQTPKRLQKFPGTWTIPRNNWNTLFPCISKTSLISTCPESTFTHNQSYKCCAFNQRQIRTGFHVKLLEMTTTCWLRVVKEQ